MAAPTIQWYKHISASNSAGTSIGELTLGTVTAGAWGKVKVISFIPSGNDVNDTKFWLSGSNAVLAGGGDVSLGNVTRTWWFAAGKTAALDAGMFSKTAKSLGGTTLACDYHPSANTAGAGLSLGTVTAAAHSQFMFVSPQPGSLAFDGTYTDFDFQISYNFS